MMHGHLTYEDLLHNNDNQNDLHIFYAYLRFVHVYDMLLHHIHWLSDLDFELKGKECSCCFKSFDKNAGSKLSEYFF